MNALRVGSKRRRPTAEVKESRREADKQEMDLQMKLAELKALERQLRLQSNELANGKEASSIVSGLISAGSLKQEPDGSWTVIQQPQQPSEEMHE